MKFRFIFTSMFILTVLLVLSGVAAAFQDGDGTALNPYQIGDRSDLEEVADYISTQNVHFILIDNIDLEGSDWVPIASSYPDEFHGIFDGNGYIISNLTQGTIAGNAGLFGHVNHSTVKNLHLTNVKINVTDLSGAGAIASTANNSTVSGCSVSGTILGRSYVGGLFGSVYPNAGKMNITNCSVINSDINSTENSAGGLVGHFNTSNLNSSYVSGTKVRANSNAGGLIGEQTSGSWVYDNYFVGDSVTSVSGKAGGLIGTGSGQIQSCYSAGIVNGATAAGGLVGEFYPISSSTTIINTYSLCSVTSTSGIAGGLVGLASNGNINRSYATGYVTGSTTGGLIGTRTSAVVNDCFFDNQTTGDTSSFDASNGTPKTTAEMKQFETFSDVGWKIVIPPNVFQVWYILPGETYPQFTYLLSNNVQVSTEEQLRYLSDNSICIAKDATGEVKYWDSTSDYTLMNDIILTQPFETINPSMTAPFSGSFDGQNFTIYNLEIYTPSASEYTGFFGTAYNGAKLKNIRLENVDITGNESVGALLGGSGSNADIIIENCHVTGLVYGNKKVGGLVGEAIDINLSKSSFEGTVNAVDSKGGGLIGFGGGVTLTNSYSNASVISDSEAGGLGGCFNGIIKNCFATGTVAANNDGAGGLIGNASQIEIQNSFALNQKVDSPSKAGRLLGNNSGSITLIDNYAWDKMSNSEGDFTLETALNGDSVTSAEVWNSFPNTVWDYLGSTTDWKLNPCSAYKLPMLTIQDSFEADASYLAPSGNGSNGNSGGGTGGGKIVENNTAATPITNSSSGFGSSGFNDTDEPEPYVEELYSFPWWILIILLLIAIATYMWYRNYRKEE